MWSHLLLLLLLLSNDSIGWIGARDLASSSFYYLFHPARSYRFCLDTDKHLIIRFKASNICWQTQRNYVQSPGNVLPHVSKWAVKNWTSRSLFLVDHFHALLCSVPIKMSTCKGRPREITWSAMPPLIPRCVVIPSGRNISICWRALPFQSQPLLSMK